MKINFNRLKKYSLFNKLQFFDYLIISIFLLAGLAFFIFLFRKADYLTLRLKITDKNVLYASRNPQSWFVYTFKKGMVEKDSLGRVNAEILDVYYYDVSSDTKAAYLTVKLRVAYSQRSQQYKYKGTSLVVGESVRIAFEQVLAEGLIVSISGRENPYKDSNLRIKAKIIDLSNNVFSETTGVEPYVADALKVGDKIFDSSGKSVVEILNKEVLPAQKNTFDDRGNVYLKTDPRKKDVYLTLVVKGKKINSEYYLFDDLRLVVNNSIPLNFKNISVFPVITEILPD